MRNAHPARPSRSLARRLLQHLAFTASLVLMGLARALGGNLRIESPEPRDRVAQVVKKR